jgi:hypothetical protein
MTLRLTARSALALVALAACSTGKPGQTSGDGGTGAGATGGSPRGGATSSGATGSGATGSGATGGSNTPSAGGATNAGSGGSGALSGAGGTNAAVGGGGSPATAGSGASGAPTGGVGGVAANGGSAGTPQPGSAGMSPGVCQQLDVVSTAQIPTVELLVDTSSSMWETMPPAWPLLYGALMDPKTGVVAPLQSKIRFGFASYKGFKASSETDPACATMTTVAPALNNHDAIDSVYQMVGSSYDPVSKPKWETPTDYAINYATKLLTDYMPDPPGKKYILLVTDGNPNTCQVIDPQCGQDLAIKATQDAFAAGIGLFVLGVGDIVVQPMNGCPTAARCGLLHLQDLANAGVGAGVHPTPGCDDWHASGCTFTHEACNQNQMLLATYTPDAPDVGMPFAVDTSMSSATTNLVNALTALLNNAVSCTVDMDAIVQGDPSLGVVMLAGQRLTFGDPNGWLLESNSTSVTLQGMACTAFKAGGTDLSITFPCDPSGNPIAVHR